MFGRWCMIPGREVFFLLLFFLHVCPLWILIAHLLQALLQMLAGRAWNDYQSQIPLASFPVTLLHGDGTRVGAGAGAEAGAGLPGDGRQQAQEINTSTGASPRSNIKLQLEQRIQNGWLAMMSRDIQWLGGSWAIVSDASPGNNSGKLSVPTDEQNPEMEAKLCCTQNLTGNFWEIWIYSTVKYVKKNMKRYER